jgi:phosphoserine phosphatase RsbU/P
VFFCVLHLRTGVLDFVNAGHNPPVIRAASGPVRMLPRNQNMALGVSAQVRPKSGRVVLRPGDTLLLYTDGIVEANDPRGRMFGEQRLLDAIMRHAPGAAGLPQAVLRAVRSFEAGRAQADDITCVAVRYRAQD